MPLRYGAKTADANVGIIQGISSQSKLEKAKKRSSVNRDGSGMVLKKGANHTQEENFESGEDDIGRHSAQVQVVDVVVQVGKAIVRDLSVVGR